MGDRVRIGIAGTSWWADAMYLPALANHPLADVRGVAGGSRPEHTREFAARWGIPAAYDSVDELLDAEPLDALLVLTPNKAHYATAMAGIERGLHVLCEKPLGMTAREARLLAEAAERAGVTTMVPFTYRFMPANRYLKLLQDEGWLGQPYHLNLRYYTGFGAPGSTPGASTSARRAPGSPATLGSHWVYMARWYFGEVRAVTALFSHLVPRGPRPDGAPFELAEDTALMLLEFENGATGSLHLSSLAHEPGPFGQRHELDLHGSGGTLRAVCDWRTVQRVEGCRAGEDDVPRAADPRRDLGHRPARHGPRHLPGRLPDPGPHDPRVRHRHRERQDGLAGLRGRARRPARPGGRRAQRPRGPARAGRGDRGRWRLMSCGEDTIGRMGHPSDVAGRMPRGRRRRPVAVAKRG